MRVFLRMVVAIVAAAACGVLCSTGAIAQQILPTSLPTGAPLSSSAPSTESDVIPINSGMFRDLFPTIPNLEFGYQYFFGPRANSGQLNADYVLPVRLGNDSVLFGEAHGNWWTYKNPTVNGASNRVDISVGGGYRRILNDGLLVGINGFYDTSRLFNSWRPSGGVGLELAANIGTTDTVDLNANWYGNIFSANDILNAFRNHGGSFDLEAGYSHALFNSQYDLRLKMAGYKFDTGFNVYGLKTGADLTTRDGMFTLRYEYGYDWLNRSWNNVGAFVNIGCQIENLAKGENPFTMPAPVFRSPRNLQRMFSQKVKRDWNQTYAPGKSSLASGTGGSSFTPIQPLIWRRGENEYRVLADISGVSASDLNPDLYPAITVTFKTTPGALYLIVIYDDTSSPVYFFESLAPEVTDPAESVTVTLTDWVMTGAQQKDLEGGAIKIEIIVEEGPISIPEQGAISWNNEPLGPG